MANKKNKKQTGWRKATKKEQRELAESMRVRKLVNEQIVAFYDRQITEMEMQKAAHMLTFKVMEAMATMFGPGSKQKIQVVGKEKHGKRK